ncbi:MAG: DNA topoisomerase IV subunit A [Alphaproteobacteria bacterium]|nr:DNA topoisomerase IV subunit A [Alphaproteobacteria bacterium]MBU0795972.1 DNA topoisomerase IV subunit A [Alphaproteobacteria bacterium]MBU0885660.1 DNA topoisomerase IV subunit A [Alphaproteobacteria bacterium]MBU1812684.1 DNA topoisomerase IV subunit A [Alphaproteobacteria bacterium]
MTKAKMTGEIRETPLADALGERYLSYALSTIMSRSLPDVRDGLKPVHRRLLFAMRQLGLVSSQGHKKSARVVGDVIGKYHPHGDTAIYDALVRLAQDFALRYPLIDGQGNFGNIDGDNAAAMRYTEARLTPVAELLLEGIDEDAVDFRGTYDGESEEPVVLPSAFPNLLANGSQGIAVGMATSIPPHNAAELCDALTLIIEHEMLAATPRIVATSELVQFVKGPDFPTGGVLVEAPDAILSAYETGRGSFRLRARWEVEKLNHGLYQIVITEIPYQVQKSRLVEKIAELMQAKKLAMLGDVRDESTTDVRLVLEPKTRNVDPAVLMESLFRQTELENRISLNMNLLDREGVPRVMTLRETLRDYLAHREEVLRRRTLNRLEHIARRLEILGGYLIAYLNLDEVIRIIREEDEPKQEMIARYDLTDLQAESILNMRLRALRKLEEIEIQKEHDGLSSEQADLQDLMAKEGRRWKVIGLQVKDLKKRFGQETALGKRRTDIDGPPSDTVIPLEAMVEREPVTILCSAKGWIRTVRGHITDDSETKYKEGDESRYVIQGETTDRLLVFSSDGKFFTIGVDKLPRGRGFGEPLRLMIDLAQDQEIVAMFIHKPGRRLLLAANDGRGFLVKEEEVLAQTRGGRQVVNPGEGSAATVCIPAEGDAVAVVGTNRKLLVFGLDEIPEMQRGRGVILQKYAGGTLSDIKVFNLADGLSWTLNGGRVRTEPDLMTWRMKRAGAGRMVPRGFPLNNRFT